jgi:NAD(P)-dependent dehydrogenase (short-subunit alcohol dehydrogenase family)
VRVTIVEPGGFRTDWAGSSMRVDEIREEYKASIGMMARKSPELMRGDPAKAAQAILTLAAMADPPLRLLLGTDAVFLAADVLRRRGEEDARMRSLSVTTDFDGMVDFADTPIAAMLTGKRAT